jgi:transcriptional regulator with XRE-family HTH domain
MQKPPPGLDEPHQRLKWAREQRNFPSASEAARAMNIPIPTYSGHENGTTPVPRDALLRYAKFFRVKVGWLLDNEGEPEGSAPVQELYESINPDLQPEALRYLEYLRDRGES